MLCKSSAKSRQMLVCLQSTEALGCFLQGGGGPSEGHRGRAPVFDVAADRAHRAHDTRYIPKPLSAATRTRRALSRCRCDEREVSAPHGWSGRCDCSLAGKVRSYLLATLGRHTSLDHAAAHLGVPVRTLRRKLRDEGTSFRDLFDQLRAEVAIKYLRDTQMTGEDIAHALGFSETANFRHAFRRWNCASPQEFRRTLAINGTGGL